MGGGRAPCCDKSKTIKGPWSPEEDALLISFVKKHGHSNWRTLPKQAGLLRCGKSCRLRWYNYLKPGVKRGNFTKEEEESIIMLQEAWGNSWSAIASCFPGRTDNEIKNYWRDHLKKRSIKKLPKTPSFSLPSSSSSNPIIYPYGKQDIGDGLRSETQGNYEMNENLVTSNVSFATDYYDYSNPGMIYPNFLPKENVGTSINAAYEDDFFNSWIFNEEVEHLPMQMDGLGDLSNDLDHMNLMGLETYHSKFGTENENELKIWLRNLEIELGLEKEDNRRELDLAQNVNGQSQKRPPSKPPEYGL